MKKGNLTREQAVEIVGEAAVSSVEKENCDFTNRCGFNGSCQGDAEVEFCASVTTDADNNVSLYAYYYQDADKVDETDDLGNLDWVVEGYEVQ